MISALLLALVLTGAPQDPPGPTPVTEGEHARCLAAGVVMLYNVEDFGGVPGSNWTLDEQRDRSSRLIDAYEARAAGPDGDQFLEQALEEAEKMQGSIIDAEISAAALEGLILACLPA
jgi:hypothetical protein